MAKVLVVDDEPDLLELARLNLEQAGYAVTTAGDGATAIAALHDAPPDVIVLDVMMPDVDGWTVLGRVKASTEPRVKEIPIVMLTAISEPEAKARGGIEGAVCWLSKPFSLDEMVAAVDAVLAEPEPVQRRRAQHRALESLARLETGSEDDPGGAGACRPRLSRLERPGTPVARPPLPDVESADTELRLDLLTDTQRHVLDEVRRAPTVQVAATTLGISRSSLYATLRRAARRLGVRSVRDLLVVLRTADRSPNR